MERESSDSNEPTAGPSGVQRHSRRLRTETETTEEGSSEELRPQEHQQNEDSNMTNPEDSNATSASSSSESTARNRKDTTTDDDDDDEDHLLKHDPTPSHAYPVPKWFSVRQLQQREYGNNLVSHTF